MWYFFSEKFDFSKILGPPQMFFKDKMPPILDSWSMPKKSRYILVPTLYKNIIMFLIISIFILLQGPVWSLWYNYYTEKRKKTTSTTKPKQTLIYIIDFWVQNIIRILLNYHVVHHPKCWPKHKFSMLKLAGFKTKRPQHSLSTMF